VLGEPPNGLDDELLVTFDDLRSLGRQQLRQNPEAVEERGRKLQPGAVAMIVYTSAGAHEATEVLATHPLVEQEIARAVERLNAERAPAERIKAWRIMPRELTVAGGELTPTMKVKRTAVMERFGDLVEEMYAT
jgi:hypothetical protein